MSTETVKSLAPIFTLKPGDEIRYGGRWLEVQSLHDQPKLRIVHCYDPEENRERRFVADPYSGRRARQLTEVTP